MITPKVVHLIPPPVDAGAAPINISIEVINFELSCKVAWSILLNPAVRAVSDWKKAASGRCQTGKEPREYKLAVLLYSNPRIETVPTASKKPVIHRTTLL